MSYACLAGGAETDKTSQRLRYDLDSNDREQLSRDAASTTNASTACSVGVQLGGGFATLNPHRTRSHWINVVAA